MSKSNHSTTADDMADRISYLPRPIIHGILSLLPTKDATRTSILSKTFYSHWTSFPVIDLDFYLYRHANLYPDVSQSEEFIDYAVRTIEPRRIEKDLQKFQLRLPIADSIDNERQDRMDKMISYAIENNVKELSVDLLFDEMDPEEYRHPLTIPGASSITKLSIIGVMLNTDDLVHDWPKLVSLHISNCSGLEAFKLSSRVIQSIELGPCRGLTSIDIESPSLEIFHYQDSFTQSECKISLTNCKSLKKLLLCDPNVDDSWIRDNIHTFPLLEDLTLSSCRKLEYPKIRNDNLKTIYVEESPILQGIEIRSENLQSLALELFEACKISIASCKHLQELCISVFAIDKERAQEFLDKILKEQVTKLTELERLELSVDLKFNKIEIKHERLRTLELHFWGHHGRHGLGEVVVDTPNLVSLNYNGWFTQLQLLNSDALHDTQLIIQGHGETDDDYFIKLWNLIETVSHSRLLTLACSAEEDLILPEEMKEELCGRPVDNREHLKVFFNYPKTTSAEMVDSLLWLWPSLKTLSLDESSIKFKHGGDSENDEDRKRCWRLSLRTVELNNFDAIDSDNLMKFFKDQAKHLHEVICN